MTAIGSYSGDVYYPIFVEVPSNSAYISQIVTRPLTTDLQCGFTEPSILQFIPCSKQLSSMIQYSRECNGTFLTADVPVAE